MRSAHVYLSLFGVLCLLGTALAKLSPPVVQVYSRTRGVLGKENILLCHVSMFHPPLIKVDLLRNGVAMEANQTEMVFETDWDYHVTKYTPFVPKSGEDYTCLVTHMGTSGTFAWEPDM